MKEEKEDEGTPSIWYHSGPLGPLKQSIMKRGRRYSPSGRPIQTPSKIGHIVGSFGTVSGFVPVYHN